MRLLFKCLSIVVLLLSQHSWAQPAQSEIIAAEDVRWGYLNPLRGDKSPGAADLWGNRTFNSATGMLVRFKKGFASPPHIHNITYRGVVIHGLLHNDDPKAERLWMPTGSFWTQPAGEEHITAADAQTNMIYLEIDSGPYLVKPSKEHFDNGERPINVHWNNLVWQGKDALRNVNQDGVKIAALWQDEAKGSYGSMLKLSPSFSGTLIGSDQLRIIVIKGAVTYQSKETESRILSAGSYIGSTGEFKHLMVNAREDEVVLYVRSEAPFFIE